MLLKANEELVDFWRNCPEAYIEDAIGEKLIDYQKTVIQMVADYDRLAIKACHDVGKTYMMGRAVLWFGSLFPQSKIITSAPTFSQVRLLLWSEINAGFNKSKLPLGGEMLQTEWKIEPDWFAVGRTTRNEKTSDGQGSSFQGIHAPYILIIFDEATGITAEMWMEAEGMLTSANVKFICIGNPTSRNSKFFDVCKSKIWKTVTITCFDSPNLKVNGFNCLQDLQDEYDRLNELPDIPIFFFAFFH